MGFYLSIGISESSVNIEKNTSVATVSVSATSTGGSYAFNYDATSVSVSCAGQSSSFVVSSYNIQAGQTVHLGSKSFTITHEADGKKTVSASATFYSGNSYIGNISASGSKALTTIPRASTFTVSSGNTLGHPMSVSISRASASFTHTVRYQFGSIVREYKGQGTSCTFTPPNEDGSQIPNAMSANGTITVYTYNGSTLIGTKSAAFSLRVDPAVFAPTFTGINVTRIDNGVPANWGIYVQGISKASIQIQGASAKYGASIKEYKISVEGVSGGNGLSAGPFRAGTINITASIVDSRNISTNQMTRITVYENLPPILTMKAERCNSAGTVINDGTYIKITPTYSCSSINGKNYIGAKEFSITDTSYKNTTASSGSSFILGNGDIAISRSYVVKGIVTDALGQKSSTISINVPSSSVPLNFRNDKTGVGIGKYSEKANAIDSAWDIYLKGVNIVNLMVPVGTILSNNQASFNPNSVYPGTKWSRYAQGRVLVGINENDGDFNTSGKTGGHKALQAHNHTASTGSAGNHNHRFKGFVYLASTAYTYAAVSHTQQSGDPWAVPPSLEAAGAHTHTVSINNAGSGNAQNLQPYVAVYMWIRTA